MANRRVGGILDLTVNGINYAIKGDWTFNLGKDMREAVPGTTEIIGFKAAPQVPFIEGAITNQYDLKLEDLLDLTDATVALQIGNGKTYVWREAWFAGEGNVTTEEGEIAARFEAISAEEL